MDKQEASKQLAEKLAQWKVLLDECVAISDASGVAFSLPYGGEGTEHRGMGATYSPEGDEDAEWNRNEYAEEYPGWHSSAGTC